MKFILKCSSKERLHSYAERLRMQTAIAYRDKDIEEIDIDWSSMFPCYLLVEINYPSCGPDYAYIDIIKTIDDLDYLVSGVA